jgi:hypothetical protein
LGGTDDGEGRPIKTNKWTPPADFSTPLQAKKIRQRRQRFRL